MTAGALLIAGLYPAWLFVFGLVLMLSGGTWSGLLLIVFAVASTQRGSIKAAAHFAWRHRIRRNAAPFVVTISDNPSEEWPLRWELQACTWTQRDRLVEVGHAADPEDAFEQARAAAWSDFEEAL